MLKQSILPATVALVCSGALVAASPSSQAGDRQSERPAPVRTEAAAQPVTMMTGCVYREQDVPGRAPNVAERVGVLEDYILADAAPANPGTQANPANRTGAVGTTGAAASRTMFKLELVDDDKLQAMVGKRVEVTGRIDAEADDAKSAAGAEKPSTTERVLGVDQIDLAEFEVSAIREIEGTCPAKPSAAPAASEPKPVR